MMTTGDDEEKWPKRRVNVSWAVVCFSFLFLSSLVTNPFFKGTTRNYVRRRGDERDRTTRVTAQETSLGLCSMFFFSFLLTNTF